MRSWRDLERASDYVVQSGEVFAHNPSIAGVAIEDSIYLTQGSYEVLSLGSGWPTREVPVRGKAIRRPEILTL